MRDGKPHLIGAAIRPIYVALIRTCICASGEVTPGKRRPEALDQCLTYGYISAPSRLLVSSCLINPNLSESSASGNKVGYAPPWATVVPCCTGGAPLGSAAELPLLFPLFELLAVGTKLLELPVSTPGLALSLLGEPTREFQKNHM